MNLFLGVRFYNTHKYKNYCGFIKIRFVYQLMNRKDMSDSVFSL